MLTRLQKEALCALLLSQGKPYRFISKQIHMSFTDIKKIDRKISGEDNTSEQDNKLSNTTRAILLFSKWTLPLDACIELDIDPQEIEKAYSSFLRLKKLSKISKIIKDPEDKIAEFTDFYELCKMNQIDKNKIGYILKKAQDISRLNFEYSQLIYEEQNIVAKSQKESMTLQNILKEIQFAKTNLEYERSNLSILENEINKKRREISNLNQQITNLKNEDNFKNFEQRLYKIFNGIISKDALNIPLIVIAFLELIRDHPVHIQIFANYYQIFKNGNIKEDLKSKQDYIFLNYMGFICEFSKKIENIYSNKTILEYYNQEISGKPQYPNFFSSS